LDRLALLSRPAKEVSPTCTEEQGGRPVFVEAKSLGPDWIQLISPSP
jgi:hypothetical protein